MSIVAVLIFGCNNGNGERTDTDSTPNAEIIVENEVIGHKDIEHEEAKLDKKLSEILKKDKELIFEQLKGLRKAIAGQDEMKSLDKVEKALKTRDSLVHLLNNSEEFYTYMEEGERFYQEFEALGIQVVEAEGMFGMLDQAPIFEKIIEKVADEPYKLFNKIKNLNASTHGSEYPYFDISHEMELIPLAEKMLTKYPGHKYNKQILEMLGYAISPLTDLHKVSGDFTQYVVGNYDVNAYPGATEISFHNDFVDKYSHSRFAKVVKKIIDNISTLSAAEFDKLYYINVPDLKSEAVFADEKLNKQLENLPKDILKANDSFKYMWLGVDIPHNLFLKNGDNTKRVIVYRFYNQKEPAEKALQKIQKVIPGAELVEYELTDADKKHKN